MKQTINTLLVNIVHNVLKRIILFSLLYNSLNIKLVITQSNQEKGLCGLIKATNIESIYTEWSCTTVGVTVTDPCRSNYMWTGLKCSNKKIISININNIGLTGKI